MGKINARKFVPTPKEVTEEGAVPMTKLEILEQLKQYKAQNPDKYETKKAALFARYGLTVEDEPALVKEPDANDLELEAIKAKVEAGEVTSEPTKI